MERNFDATRTAWIAQNLFDANGNWSPGRHATLDGAWLPDGDIVTEFEARRLTGIGETDDD